MESDEFTESEWCNTTQTIKVGNKEIPVITAKSKTIIKNKKTGVIYKDEAEWKGLGN